MKKLFLLGGHDLEMLAIRQMLEGRQDCAVADRQLRWDNAVLSTYKDILDGNVDCDIYGIELREDMPVPAGYHRIDHHNDLAALPSSLEQVAAVLGVQPDRRQQLIAANDKGYIPAMKAMGATDEEIWEIRLQDRQAQGVTEEDERLAETSIAEHLEKVGDTLFVRSLTPRFSAVCDRLFPYKRLVVYTDAEWVFYGEGKEQFAGELSDDIKAGRVYHGGGPSGYIGAATGAFPEKEIQDFVTSIKHRYG